MASVERVSVALTPEVADMVRRAVESGEYFSDNEVVAEALREWMLRRTHQDQFNELRDLWTEGLASGPGRMQSIEDIKQEARNRLAARSQSDN